MNQQKLTFLDIAIMVLSIYVLGALLIDSFFKLSTEMSQLISLLDNLICIVFLYDFFYRLLKAKSKLQFMRWGWIDFISSIPTFNFLQYGRTIRLIRVIRVMRVFRSVRFLIQHIFKSRINGTFAAVALIAFLTLIFGSIGILQVETTPNSNIKSAEDALWWAFTTITTVGYGDKYPITTEGRLIAAILMTTGVGLFGTFTGYVASWFLNNSDAKDNNDWIIQLEKLKELQERGILSEDEFNEQKSKVLIESMN